MAGLGREKTSFWEARRPDGQPMFLVEQRSGGEREPETLLLDHSGTVHAIVRRVSAHPASYTVLNPDGSLLGSIVPVKGAKWGAFETKDQQGRQWAAIAAKPRQWVLRLVTGAPSPFPGLLLAFTFDQLRRPPR
jgi:hypothetical protein